MRRSSPFLAVPLLVLGLACGGVWSQAMQQVVGDKANELRGKILAADDSPERARALAAVDTFASDPDKATVMSIAMFEVAVEEVVSDGVITDVEASRLEQAAAGN
jgi:hypothetical protein